MVQLYALVSCICAYHRWYWFGEKTERNWWNECEDNSNGNSNSNSNTADRPTSRSTSLGKEIQGAQIHTIGASYMPAAKNTDGVHTRHTRPNQTKQSRRVCILFVICFSLRSSQFSAFESFASSFVLLFLFLVCIIIILLVNFLANTVVCHLLWFISTQTVLVEYLFFSFLYRAKWFGFKEKLR